MGCSLSEADISPEGQLEIFGPSNSFSAENFPDDWVLGKGILGTAVNAIMPDDVITMLKHVKGLAMGGPISAGKPYMVGEQGPEMIIPSGPGRVINAQRTDAMQEAMLRRNTSSVSAGGQPIIAPTTVANTNSTNITNTTTSIVNPDQVISTVNKAA